MNVTVRVFAGLRTLVGDKDFSLALADGSTIAALRQRLSEEYPVLEAMVSTLVTAVNSDEQPPEYVLHDGDLVDVIPPISGGWYMPDKPQILFVCVHNAGRSQMAAAFARRLGGDRVDVRSAGSEPASAIHPSVIDAMLECGIDLRAESPQLLDDADVRASDAVITMGCGDACAIYPGKRYEDWKADDPAGMPIERVRVVRDEIERRVRSLLADMRVGSGSG